MHALHTTDQPSPAVQMDADPYRFPGAWYLGGRTADTLTDPFVDAFDHGLPAPDPKERVPYVLPIRDQRRLDVHTALTAAGVAPLPGDLEAINALCKLEDSAFATVVRWITGTRPDRMP